MLSVCLSDLISISIARSVLFMLASMRRTPQMSGASFTGAARHRVDGREDAPVGEIAVELELQIAGAFELLEDHLVHLGTRIDQRRRENRKRAAAFDIASRAEEAFGRIERR